MGMEMLIRTIIGAIGLDPDDLKRRAEELQKTLAEFVAIVQRIEARQEEVLARLTDLEAGVRPAGEYRQDRDPFLKLAIEGASDGVAGE